MRIERLCPESELWGRAVSYVRSSSWEAGDHLAKFMEANKFTDWEAMFVALDEEGLIGFCTLMKEDYYPDNRYSPWISNVFVDERARGHRVSGKLIDAAAKYAKEAGFDKVYIPTDISGLYEKYGFKKIGELENYGGNMDSIFMRECE